MDWNEDKREQHGRRDFDIVDEKGQPKGETVTRSQAHAEGIRHRTAHIWVVRENGDKTEMKCITFY